MRYQINRFTSDGISLSPVTSFRKLEYVRAVNSIGTLTLTLTQPQWLLQDWSTNQIFEVWREKNGILQLQNETAYFLRDWYAYEQDGEHLIDLIAFDANWLLSTRIVGYFEDTDEANKSGYADDIMKEYVKENLGSLADAVTAWTVTETRVLPRFTVAPDVSASAQLDMEAAWRPLIDVCSEIANSATEQGINTFFDVVRTAPATFEFRTYVNRRGQDHSRSSSNVRFVGKKYGNLVNPRIGVQHSNEFTFVVGGGAGTGSDRVIDPERARLRVADGSPYNYIEMFQNAGGLETLQEVADVAYAVLCARRPKTVITGQLVDTYGMQYNVDYSFGDVVTAEAYGQFIDCHVQSVYAVVDTQKLETLTISLRGEVLND